MQRVTLTLDDDLLAALDALSARRATTTVRRRYAIFCATPSTRSSVAGITARVCRPVVRV